MIAGKGSGDIKILGASNDYDIYSGALTVLTLHGRVLKVEKILAKVKAAVRVGADVILIPEDNKEEIQAADFDGKDRVVFVRTVLDAFLQALEGTWDGSCNVFGSHNRY